MYLCLYTYTHSYGWRSLEFQPDSTHEGSDINAPTFIQNNTNTDFIQSTAWREINSTQNQALLKMAQEVVESAWDSEQYGQFSLLPYSRQTAKQKNAEKTK